MRLFAIYFDTTYKILLFVPFYFRVSDVMYCFQNALPGLTLSSSKHFTCIISLPIGRYSYSLIGAFSLIEYCLFHFVIDV
jgi:hypothetical protein